MLSHNSGCVEAADRNDLDYLKANYIENETDFLDIKVLAIAAKHGHLRIIEWMLLEKNCKYTTTAASFAAEHNQFHILQWFQQHIQNPFKDLVAIDAICGSSMTTLKWLHTHGCPFDTSYCYSAAIYNNRLNVFKWLYEIRCPIYHSIIPEMIVMERYDFLKYVLQNKVFKNRVYHSFYYDDHLNHTPCSHYYDVQWLRTQNLFNSNVDTWLNGIHDALSSIFCHDLTHVCKTYI